MQYRDSFNRLVPSEMLLRAHPIYIAPDGLLLIEPYGDHILNSYHTHEVPLQCEDSVMDSVDRLRRILCGRIRDRKLRVVHDPRNPLDTPPKFHPSRTGSEEVVWFSSEHDSPDGIRLAMTEDGKVYSNVPASFVWKTESDSVLFMRAFAASLEYRYALVVPLRDVPESEEDE